MLGNGSPRGVSTTLLTTLVRPLPMTVLSALLETLPRTFEVTVMETLGASLGGRGGVSLGALAPQCTFANARDNYRKDGKLEWRRQGHVILSHEDTMGNELCQVGQLHKAHLLINSRKCDLPLVILHKYNEIFITTTEENRLLEAKKGEYNKR